MVSESIQMGWTGRGRSTGSQGPAPCRIQERSVRPVQEPGRVVMGASATVEAASGTVDSKAFRLLIVNMAIWLAPPGQCTAPAAVKPAGPRFGCG